MNAIIPVNRAIIAWHTGAAFPVALVAALSCGLVLGLAGLGSASTAIVKRSAQSMAERPAGAQIGLAGLVAGGPTFLGTMVGYTFSSPTVSVFFLATAIGALVFVIGELWSVLKKTGVTIAATSMVTAGFAIAFVTEAMISVSGG